MRRFFICLFLTLISLSLIGCSTKTVFSKVAMPASGVVRISPSALFEGDTKKLEPHLGIISGCVKLKYSGPEKFIKMAYEIWENGSLKKSSNSLGVSVDKGYDGEISISLKDESSDKSKQIKRLTIVMNGCSSTSDDPDINIPDYAARKPIMISKTMEVTDDKETAIWGYAAYKNGSFRPEESIEEDAKKADWAFVVKVSFDEK